MSTKVSLQNYVNQMREDEEVFALLISSKDVRQRMQDEGVDGCIKETEVYKALREWEAGYDTTSSISFDDALGSLCKDFLALKVVIHLVGGKVEIVRQPANVEVEIVDYDHG